MRVVHLDSTNNLEIEEFNQFFETIIAIETLRPQTHSETNAHIVERIFENRKELALPFGLKQSRNFSDFQTELKRSFIIIKHANFKLRLSVLNNIGKDRNYIIGGILKILAKHSPDYNKYKYYDGSLFDDLIVPDILNAIIVCRIYGSKMVEHNAIIYTSGNYKLVTKKIDDNFDDIITFHPLDKCLFLRRVFIRIKKKLSEIIKVQQIE